MPDKFFDSKRLQEIKPGEHAPEVYTVNAVTAAVAQQRFFLAGSGRLTLGVAGNIRCRLANPAGSGRNMVLARLVAMATVVGWAELRLNPTTGLPAGARTPFNAILGGAAASGTMEADTNTVTALGGGTLLSPVVGVPPNTRISLDLPPLVLAPGVSLGINVPIAGAGDATVSAYWFEEDL